MSLVQQTTVSLSLSLSASEPEQQFVLAPVIFFPPKKNQKSKTRSQFLIYKFFFFLL